MTSHFNQAYIRASRLQRPFSVLFEVNHLCHLDCAECYLEDNHDKSRLGEQVSFDEACRIIDELKAAGTLILALSGGEIFLRKDILSIAAHARSRGLAVRMFTSGTLLSEEKIKALAELHLASLEITLYSLDPVTHDGITRTAGSCEKTISGILAACRSRLPVTIKMPLMRPNFRGYKRVRDFAREVGAAFRCDPTITPQTNGDLKPLELRLTASELVELYADPEISASVVSCSNEPPDPDRRTCAIGERSCVISPFGEVFPCMEVREVAGNLRQQSFAEVWSSSPVLTRARGHVWGELTLCNGCSKASYCQRCNGLAAKEDGDFFGPASWSCTMAAAKEVASGIAPRPAASGFVPLSLLVRSAKSDGNYRIPG